MPPATSLGSEHSQTKTNPPLPVIDLQVSDQAAPSEALLSSLYSHREDDTVESDSAERKSLKNPCPCPVPVPIPRPVRPFPYPTDGDEDGQIISLKSIRPKRIFQPAPLHPHPTRKPIPISALELPPFPRALNLQSLEGMGLKGNSKDGPPSAVPLPLLHHLPLPLSLLSESEGSTTDSILSGENHSG